MLAIPPYSNILVKSTFLENFTNNFYFRMIFFFWKWRSGNFKKLEIILEFIVEQNDVLNLCLLHFIDFAEWFEIDLFCGEIPLYFFAVWRWITTTFSSRWRTSLAVLTLQSTDQTNESHDLWCFKASVDLYFIHTHFDHSLWKCSRFLFKRRSKEGGDHQTKIWFSSFSKRNRYFL